MGSLSVTLLPTTIKSSITDAKLERYSSIRCFCTNFRKKDVSLHLMTKINNFLHEARKYMIIIIKAATQIISINSGILKQLYRFCNNIASLYTGVFMRRTVIYKS